MLITVLARIYPAIASTLTQRIITDGDDAGQIDTRLKTASSVVPSVFPNRCIIVLSGNNPGHPDARQNRPPIPLPALIMRP
jgi:hypothetical protein